MFLPMAIFGLKVLKSQIYLIKVFHVCLKSFFKAIQILHWSNVDCPLAQWIILYNVILIRRHHTIIIYNNLTIVFLLLELLHHLQCPLVNIKHFFNCQHAGIPRTFKSLHKQDSHHLDKEHFSVDIVIPFLVSFLSCFLYCLWDIATWLIGCKKQFLESCIYLFGSVVFAEMLHSLIHVYWLVLIGKSEVLA